MRKCQIFCANVLSSQKRSRGRNLGEHRLARRPEVLLFCLRMRSFAGTELLPYTWADTLDRDKLWYPSLEMNEVDKNLQIYEEEKYPRGVN